MRNAIQFLAKVCEKISFVFFVIAGLFLVLTAILITLSSVSRYGFKLPIASVVDVTGFALYFVTFLSAPWILHKDKHVNVDILKEYLSPKKQKFVSIINNLITFLCSIVLFGFGAYLTYDQFVRAEKLFGTLEIPKYTLTVVLPLSGLLLMAITLTKLVQSVNAYTSAAGKGA